jgi:hypothetical protein
MIDSEEMKYKKQLNKYSDIFIVWEHHDKLMVIGHEARLITPFDMNEERYGFFAVFESPARGRTLISKLEKEGSKIISLGEWEMTGSFPAANLRKVAKILNIRERMKLTSEQRQKMRERLPESFQRRRGTPISSYSFKDY